MRGFKTFPESDSVLAMGIYVYIYSYIYMSVMLLVPRRTPLNAQRANVGPASNA